MPQDRLPPGYEIVPSDTEYFVKKEGKLAAYPSGKEMGWSKKSEKRVYQWCWETYRREQAIPFEDYVNVVQTLPAHSDWKAVFLHDDKEDLYHLVPIACWAQVEIFDGPYKRTYVVGMVPNIGDDVHTLDLISMDCLSFLGYTYPDDETDWKREAYRCIKKKPGVSGYTLEDVLFWEQEAEKQEPNEMPQKTD